MTKRVVDRGSYVCGLTVVTLVQKSRVFIASYRQAVESLAREESCTGSVWWSLGKSDQGPLHRLKSSALCPLSQLLRKNSSAMLVDEYRSISFSKRGYLDAPIYITKQQPPLC